MNTMDYSYLNQGTFEANCSLSGMESLPNCQLPGSYSDLGPCGQMGQYRYNPVRSFSTTPPISTASCSMMPRARDHPQPAMFPSGKCSKI